MDIFRSLVLANNVEMKKFALDVVTVTPQLFSGVIECISIPDIQNLFLFVSTLHLAGTLYRDGPSVKNCLGENTVDNLWKVEHMKNCIYPNQLKPTLVRQALQHSNHLVVIETLKFLITISSRLQTLVSDVQSGSDQDSEIANRLAYLSRSLLPDSQILFTVITNVQLKARSSFFVAERVSFLLKLISTFFPNILWRYSFDWVRLLLGDEFSQSLPAMQLLFLNLMKEMVIRGTVRYCLLILLLEHFGFS